MSQKRYKAAEVADALHEAEGVVTTAAKILGCDRQTVYNYADEFVTVRDALRTSRRGLVGEAQGYLVAMMRDRAHKDHYKAVKDILTTYDQDTDWSERQRQELSGSVALARIERVNTPPEPDA